MPRREPSALDLHHHFPLAMAASEDPAAFVIDTCVLMNQIEDALLRRLMHKAELPLEGKPCPPIACVLRVLEVALIRVLIDIGDQHMHIFSALACGFQHRPAAEETYQPVFN